MIVRTSLAKQHLIFGYMVNDRLGNAIFGENSLCIEDASIEFSAPGDYQVNFSFRWPEIAPGQYTITLGVGEGTDPLTHTIQAWAHNCYAVQAICPDTVVHCLFNNRLQNISYNRR